LNKLLKFSEITYFIAKSRLIVHREVLGREYVLLLAAPDIARFGLVVVGSEVGRVGLVCVRLTLQIAFANVISHVGVGERKVMAWFRLLLLSSLAYRDKLVGIVSEELIVVSDVQAKFTALKVLGEIEVECRCALNQRHFFMVDLDKCLGIWLF
jgi:hypothetical protein